jgi:hypothetical protein
MDAVMTLDELESRLSTLSLFLSHEPATKATLKVVAYDLRSFAAEAERLAEALPD